MLPTTFRRAVASRLAMPRPAGTAPATTPRNNTLHTLAAYRPQLNVNINKAGDRFGPSQVRANKPFSRSYAEHWGLGRAAPLVHGLTQENTELRQCNEELKLLNDKSVLMLDDSNLLMEKSNLLMGESILLIEELAARERTANRISFWALLFGGFGICSAVYFWQFPPVQKQRETLEKSKGKEDERGSGTSNAYSRGHVNSDACMGEGGGGDDCCALHVLRSMKA